LPIFIRCLGCIRCSVLKDIAQPRKNTTELSPFRLRAIRHAPRCASVRRATLALYSQPRRPRYAIQSGHHVKAASLRRSPERINWETSGLKHTLFARMPPVIRDIVAIPSSSRRKRMLTPPNTLLLLIQSATPCCYAVFRDATMPCRCRHAMPFMRDSRGAKILPPFTPKNDKEKRQCAGAMRAVCLYAAHQRMRTMPNHMRQQQTRSSG